VHAEKRIAEAIQEALTVTKKDSVIPLNMNEKVISAL